MAVGQIFSFASQQVLFIWLLILICPIYIVFATFVAKGMQILYLVSLNRNSIVYRYLGDVSWIFPFKASESEFKLVHIVMIANLAGIISIIILLAVMLQNQYEKKQEPSVEKKKKVRVEKNE